MTLAADVANLRVNVDFSGNASSEINKIKSSLGGFGSVGGAASSALGLVERGAGGVGSAFSHLKGTIGGLLTGPLGFIGLGAGLFSVAGALEKGISTANDMAGAIEKLAPLTGDTAEQVSSLLAVFNKFGISTDTATTRIAFMEKAVGNLALSSKKAADFQKEFGFSVLDASGHVKDANTLILQAADYWNGSASAAEKAAFEAKLFGRGFADMIPILNLGSKGIQQAEQAAASLGLTLTATNVSDLQKYQATMRDLGDTVGGLQLQLSLALVPAIEDVAKSATAFIAQNRTGIVSFFKDLIADARTAAGFLTGTIIPDLQSLASAAAGFWNSIPGPLRDILVKGFAADRAMKFLFGFDPVTTIGSIIGKQLLSVLGGGIGGVVAKVAGSALDVQKVFVVNMAPGFGGVGGAAEDAGAVAGAEAGGGVLEALGLGSLTALTGTVAAIALPLAGAWVLANMAKPGAWQAGLNGPPTANAASQNLAHPGWGGSGSSNGGATGLLQTSVNELSDIKQDTITSIHLGAQALAIQKQAAAHQASEKTIAQIAGTNHNFLELFRSGNAKSAVKLFPAEFGYLSTASAATKSTSQYVSGVKQDITALQTASVSATNEQKVKLAADIVTLQNLVKDTTAAVKNQAIIIGGVVAGDRSDKSGDISITTTTTHKSTTVAKQKTNRVGGP